MPLLPASPLDWLHLPGLYRLVLGLWLVLAVAVLAWTAVRRFRAWRRGKAGACRPVLPFAEPGLPRLSEVEMGPLERALYEALESRDAPGGVLARYLQANYAEYADLPSVSVYPLLQRLHRRGLIRAYALFNPDTGPARGVTHYTRGFNLPAPRPGFSIVRVRFTSEGAREEVWPS
jgi:hypothetical protein